MADPMTPERLAEIRDLSMNSTSGYATYNPDIWTLDAARRELVAEVERLRHDLDVQRAAMATMLADERQMQAAHDRTRAELDAARAEVKQLRALVEEALHLRQNGECAPGGTETWHEWDLKAPTVLRALDGTEATP